MQSQSQLALGLYSGGLFEVMISLTMQISFYLHVFVTENWALFIYKKETIKHINIPFHWIKIPKKAFCQTSMNVQAVYTKA